MVVSHVLGQRLGRRAVPRNGSRTVRNAPHWVHCLSSEGTMTGAARRSTTDTRLVGWPVFRHSCPAEGTREWEILPNAGHVLPHAGAASALPDAFILRHGARWCLSGLVQSGSQRCVLHTDRTMLVVAFLHVDQVAQSDVDLVYIGSVSRVVTILTI